MPYFLAPTALAPIAARVFPATAGFLGGGSRVVQRVGGKIGLFVPDTISIAGRTVTGSALVSTVTGMLRAAGIVGGAIAVVEVLTDIVPGTGTGILPGGGGDSTHPGQVVKNWTANGVQFVRLADGRMGAYSQRRGAWKYWRPKKPIVMYSNGSSSLVTLLKADKAAERQLRKLQKAINRRFPGRRRSGGTSGHSHAGGTTIIQEGGPGGVQRT